MGVGVRDGGLGSRGRGGWFGGVWWRVGAVGFGGGRTEISWNLA